AVHIRRSFCSVAARPTSSTLFPYTTLFRSAIEFRHLPVEKREVRTLLLDDGDRFLSGRRFADDRHVLERPQQRNQERPRTCRSRSEEHTSELQSRGHLVCRLLLEQKNITDR